MDVFFLRHGEPIESSLWRGDEVERPLRALRKFMTFSFIQRNVAGIVDGKV
jgi:hypothetical protein